MANYNVVMGQGVTVANLAGNMLLTGAGDVADALITCSAVVLYNSVTGAAGLFHFPEGSINTDEASRNAITAMAAAVQPNRAWIGWGTFGLGNDDLRTQQQREQLEHGEQLRSFVLHLLPLTCRLSRFPARTGVVTFRLNAGNPTIGSQVPDNRTDLRNDAAGNHGAYTTYGAAL